MNEKVKQILDLIKEKNLTENEKSVLINYLKNDIYFGLESLSLCPTSCPVCGRKLP